MLHRFSLNDSSSLQVSAKQIRFARHYRDNKWLFSKHIKGGLWLASENNDGSFTQPKELLNSDEFSTRYNWTVQQDTIYYAKNHPDRVEIKSYNLVSQSSDLLLSLPSADLETYGVFTFDSANQWLIYTQRKGNHYDIAKIVLPKH